MRERGLEFRVGVLMLVATALLVAFIFVLGNLSFRKEFTIYVDYAYVGSLQPGAPVKVSGIKVGKVTDVVFWGGKADAKIGGERVQVRLTVLIEERVRESIRGDAEFFINTAGVLGEQYLEIVPGHNYESPAITDNTIVHGAAVHDPPRTDLVVSKLYQVLDGVAEVLHEDRDAIKNLLSNGASAVHEVNDLLHENREQIASLIGNAADLSKEAKVTLTKVNNGLGDGKPIASLIAHADTTLVTANDSLKSLTPPATELMTDATRVTKLVTEDRVDKLMTVADTAGKAAGKAGGLVDNVNGMVTDLRAGKGTAGALLAKDDVYADLRELVRDLKRNPWKFFWKE